MSKVKSTVRPVIAVPQTKAQAEDEIASIGIKQRELLRIQANMNDQISVIKSQFEQQAQPYKDDIATQTDAVRTWAEANRLGITNNGKLQSASLASGDIEWRKSPPKVTVRGVAKVLEFLQVSGLQKFIRSKQEINKEAMLADPQAANAIPGITIGSAGEMFAITPYETELTNVS